MNQNKQEIIFITQFREITCGIKRITNSSSVLKLFGVFFYNTHKINDACNYFYYHILPWILCMSLNLCLLSTNISILLWVPLLRENVKIVVVFSSTHLVIIVILVSNIYLICEGMEFSVKDAFVNEWNKHLFQLLLFISCVLECLPSNLSFMYNVQHLPLAFVRGWGCTTKYTSLPNIIKNINFVWNKS